MVKKIVLVGAGSAQFGISALGDIFQSKPFEGSHISLLDINEEANKQTLKRSEQAIEQYNLNFKVTATTDRKEALKGADFVIISIEVGDRFALWDLDWQIPQQFGIKQIYGENGGPGGFFHSLRIIPPILEICADIDRYCGDAWIFSFSNPLSRICTTVKRKFPNLRFIGMCHEIASLERHLPNILNRNWDELNIQAAGLNHFSSLLKIEDNNGNDLYDELRENAPAYFKTLPGYSEICMHYNETGEIIDTETSISKHNSKFSKSMRPWGDRGVFKRILEDFNLLPITGDSHFGEYIPWAFEDADHQGILDFYDYYKAVLGGIKPKIKLVAHERVIFIMEALIGSAPPYIESAVNIENNGSIKNLPDWLVVEVPARIDENGIHGEKLDMPPGMLGLLSNQIGIHDLTAETVLQKSKDLALQALLVDPIVNKSKSLNEMLDVFISRQRPWLDYLE